MSGFFFLFFFFFFFFLPPTRVSVFDADNSLSFSLSKRYDMTNMKKIFSLYSTLCLCFIYDGLLFFSKYAWTIIKVIKGERNNPTNPLNRLNIITSWVDTNFIYIGKINPPSPWEDEKPIPSLSSLLISVVEGSI